MRTKIRGPIQLTAGKTSTLFADHFDLLSVPQLAKESRGFEAQVAMPHRARVIASLVLRDFKV